MSHTLRDLAERTGATVEGDGDCEIAGLAGIREARRGDITFLANRKYLRDAHSTAASALIVAPDLKVEGKNLLVHPNPSLAFIRVAEVFFDDIRVRAPHRGVHPQAVVAQDVVLGDDVVIHPFAVVEAGARLGDRTVLYPFVFVGQGTSIGADCTIYPNVAIRERCRIGDRVIIHCGTVIGSDGFGYLTLEGKHLKIPQLGVVEIEDDVEIGANVTIDRARFNRTVIHRGTKIDNLVMIAHNVRIGNDSLIIAQVGISGSTQVGRHVVLAGQAGVVGHITIGDRAKVGGQAGVTKSVPADAEVSGYPARPHLQQLRLAACVEKLPELIARVERLEQALSAKGKPTSQQR